MELANKTGILAQDPFYVSKEYICKYGMPFTYEIFQGFTSNISFLILIPIFLTLSSYFFCVINVRNILKTQPKAFVTKSLTMIGVYPVSLKNAFLNLLQINREVLILGGLQYILNLNRSSKNILFM